MPDTMINISYKICTISYGLHNSVTLSKRVTYTLVLYFTKLQEKTMSLIKLQYILDV